ncbi:Response regulator receiver domain-containing protein [Methylobacterium sp. 190mf]|uniref:response regulator transcription factor n=1 Tax=Methylobacterium sp. 190mf TaxID=1761798 RepID=UPI00089EAAB8|nr:response regulator [Methylobacterium sp. 190mf]SEG53250.1 Response regulator receiver domain-containing protein [Methylobacterium sp. 190mf]
MPLDPSNLIYVVDDDPAVLHSTRFLLESEGHEVETFVSGSELLAAFPGPHPDLVLIDQVMARMDGLEVFTRLRDLDARVPVVLITGHPDPGIRTRARAAGVPVVEKPLAFDALLGMLAANRVTEGVTPQP